MDIFYPKYYDMFACIASECPDGCCKEWNVDVDEASAAFYRSLPGPLGDRLRQVLSDTEDGTIMTIENSRCPMWRQDGLCQIQAELGHDALCNVCREFPRLRHDYGNFVELGLELSCPEAARLILSEEAQNQVAKTSSEKASPEYDTDIMEILRRSRRDFLSFLDATTLSFPQVLAVLLLYVHDVQEELDGGAPAILDWEGCLADAVGLAQRGEIGSVLEFFLNLEILTPQWKERLESPAAQPRWETGYTSLLRYFIGRYWLQAISDYDVICRGKLAVVACLLIGYLGGNLLKTAQLFSKEIENNSDNIEAILDGTYTSPALTDLNLLGLLQLL